MTEQRIALSDFHKPNLELSQPLIVRLAKQWINDTKSEDLSPVDEALIYGAENNPDTCFDIIIEICNLTDDEKLLRELGVGALEDLMADCADKLEDKVIEQFENNKSFNSALKCVFLNENDNGYSVLKRLISEFKYL